MTWRIRAATAADAAVIAHHRIAMFRDMGRLVASAEAPLRRATTAWLATAMPAGEYHGWLASPTGDPGTIVAGAGVQERRVLPFPRTGGDGGVTIAEGRQAIVVNVYTEPAYRRRGIARLLMRAVLDWSRSVHLESLVLHATPDGRPLYESLGFARTNEMRYMGDLHVEPAAPAQPHAAR